jgi:hypothetical protein
MGCGVVGAIFPAESGLKVIGFIGAASCVAAAIYTANEKTAWQLTDRGKLQKEATRQAISRAVESTFKGLFALAGWARLHLLGQCPAL